MTKQLLAKYPGRCIKTGKKVKPGDLISYDTATKRVVLIESKPSGVSSVSFFSEGVKRTFYRNANGRCEDAPCCGCCTI